MSGNPGPLASTKGESTSSKTTKSGYDHLDINKLYKGKSTEPVAKTVTQKHGMQTLGKAPPARRPGNLTAVKSDSTSNDVSSSPSVPQISSSAAPTLGQGQPHPPPGWANTLPHPPGPPSPHNVPSVPTTGQPVHEKNWSGGPERSGNFPSQRFAQEFPTLDSGGDAPKIPQTNSIGPPIPASGPQSVLKPHDSQYGPGPILRPQTEGSWIQGGGRNMQRPPGPVPPSNAPARDFGPVPERVLGGPTPPPMSLGQGGPAPPPLGAYSMQFRGMGPPPPYMYQNSGPPQGPGGFYPPGPGMPPRYGMPIPPGAPPPPGSHPPDGPREPGRNRGPPPQARPGSHFTANPIIKQEDLERMDELAQDGGWASTMDDVDYNKKINFEDEEEERREGAAFKAPVLRGERKEEEQRERRHVNAKNIERQPSISERDHDREREPRFDNREREHSFDHPENDEDWKRNRNNVPFDKDRERGNRRNRDDDWRSGNNRFEEDRNKKVAPVIINRQDARAAPDFSNKYSNIAPRFLRQQQQGTQQPMSYPQQPPNQRQTPSPVSISTNTAGKERENREFRDREWDRDRDPNRDRPPSRDMNFKILDRRRVDSESSREGPRDANKRFGNVNEYDSNLRNERFQEKDQSKNSRFGPSDFQRERSKESDESKSPNTAVTASKGAELERSEQSIESKESSRKQEENKVSFRSKPEFTSWADEVDDDEFNREAEDSALRKSAKENALIPQPKREFPKSDERDRTGKDFAHRRIYIQQRKVEDMRTQKPDPQPELKQATEPVKQDKPVDKSKPTSVWGDRENQRERLKQENESSSQPKEAEAKSPSVEKETRKSVEKDTAPQKPESQQKQVEQNVNEKIEKRPTEKEPKDRERRESREKLERVDQKSFERPMPKQDSRFDRGPPASDRERMMDRDRHDHGMERSAINRPNDRDRHMERNYDRHMGDRQDNRDRDRNDRGERNRDNDRSGNRDRNSDRPILDRERASVPERPMERQNQGDRDRRDRDMHHNREKGKPRRWDYDKRDSRETRTPDRDYNLGRNSESSYGAPMSLPTEKTQHDRDKDIESHKTKDVKSLDKFKSNEKIDSFKDSNVKEKSVVEKEAGNKDSAEREREKDREDNRSKDDNKIRDSKDVERRDKIDREDIDDRSGRDNKSQRGGRNRDRGGGAWESARPGPRGGRGAKTGRGSNSSGFYDRPTSKRSDSERERDEKDSVKEEPHQEQDITKDKKSEKADNQEKKEGSLDDVSKSKRDKDKDTSSDSSKKVAKSPSTSKRNMRGSSRLQGYGPPSDKIPFSSNAANKDDDNLKDKSSDHPPSKQSPQISTSGPIPLMELGEISPPNMPPRSRHGYQQGSRGNRNPVPPRLQREEQYPPYNRGSGNGKRGRNNDSAKPLMSLNSNELERGEWETESESDDDSKKNGQGGSSKGKKESSKGGVAEKYPRPNQSQNQNLSRNSAKLSGSTNSEQNNSSNNQDSTNNNSRGGKTSGGPIGRTGGSNVETDSFSGVIGMDSHETADNSDNVDGDSGGFQEVRNKKNFGAKDKGFTVSKTATRTAEKVVKGRPVKNPPYEARPNQSKDIPPRFLAKAHQQQPTTGGKVTEGNGSFPKEPTTPQGNAWEKPITANLRPEQGSHQSMTQSSSIESKDSLDLKISNVNTSMPHVAPKPVASLLDGTNPPVRTVIFENTNLKSGGKFTDVAKSTATSKISDLKKDGNITSSLEIGKELPLNFGKAPGENSPELDFGSSPFDDPSNSSQSAPSQQIQSHAPAKPMSIAQSSRSSYVSHQPSPISPLAADLNEKIQSVKRVWDVPSMPSVAEQTSVSGSEENSFHGGFGAESFKGTDSTNRDFTQSLQQTSTGYAPGSSPALSAIAKPDSSSSPNATTMRQVSQPGKTQQPSGMENQSHATMSSPFSGYAMQHQGATTFGGMPAVPSPPTVMYGASQPHLHGGPGVYQTFPHDGPQVLNTNARSQYSQYASAQAANAGPYGLGGSLFLTSIDSSYQPLSVSSYQHQQASQGGPPGQPQNQNNRISPGPLTTSGGGNAVMINSTSNSMMSIKSQVQGSSGNHPNMSHQVHPGAQAYSQLSHHHHPAAMGHPSHHMGTVGPTKGGYSQGGLSAQSQTQVFIPFDPNQASVINIGQNYLSTGIRSGPPGGPPPSATPPVQALQASSSYYSGSSGNQTGVYPSGSAQGGGLQQLQIAVAPNPQALQNLQNASQHSYLQYQSPLNIPGYNSQAAAATVSALNLGNPLVRPGQHSYIKPGIDMVQTSQLKSSHDSLMNQSWNTSAFQLNQNFHGGNKTGNISDRNNVNNMNSQRKGNNHMPSMGSMNKYSNPGYPGQKGGGRFSAPGPIQRPISTSPSTGPGGVPSSSHSLPASVSMTGIGVIAGPVGGIKIKNLSNEHQTGKHLTSSGGGEEGLLDKLITTEAGQQEMRRTLATNPDNHPSKMILPSGSRPGDLGIPTGDGNPPKISSLH